MTIDRLNSISTPPTLNEVPVLPPSAPFTLEQRAWLNGFLAGLFSRAPLVMPPSAQEAAASQPLQSLTILFGSQTGNAEVLAKRAAKAAGQRGFVPTVCDLAQYDCHRLTQEQNVLLITSTYGDGEPPDSARNFWKFVHDGAAPALPHLRFSVCALGDTNYQKFCQCGKDFDRRFGELNALRVFPRSDCDVEFAAPFAQWLDGVLPAMAGAGAPAPTAPPQLEVAVRTPPTEADEPAWSRTHPFPATLLANRLLNAEGSAKETRHYEISLAGSGLNYTAGDALGVMPTNDPVLVDEIIRALRAGPDTLVPGGQGAEAPLRAALLASYEITRISKPMLALFASRTGDDQLKILTSPNVNGELEKYLWGREIIDLLLAFPGLKLVPGEFVACLKKLQPRCYSIASSPKANPGQVHLTVATVRYQSLGRMRLGVCSSFLADRVPSGGTVPVFMQPNRNFRLPDNGACPVIMVGPGTGLAPFRAFLQERKATNARGKNWLFFGDQREATDFLYRDELNQFLHEGTLTRLHTAFSRDQVEKIYVQQRLLENAGELYAWLEEGAYFYVCGDASRMARDVDAALHQVVERGGSKTPKQAADYVERLRTQRRYQRDVY